MSKIIIVCGRTYNPPTTPPASNPNLQPPNPSVRELLLYGQIMLVNKIYNSYRLTVYQTIMVPLPLSTSSII